MILISIFVSDLPSLISLPKFKIISLFKNFPFSFAFDEVSKKSAIKFASLIVAIYFFLLLNMILPFVKKIGTDLILFLKIGNYLNILV